MICGMPLSMYNQQGICFHHKQYPKKRVRSLKEERANATPYGSALRPDPRDFHPVHSFLEAYSD